MDQVAGNDTLVAARGWPRGSRGGRFRRYANFGADLGWLTIGSLAFAVRRGIDLWYSPANVLPLAIPRPMVVTVHDVNFLTIDGYHDRTFTRYANLAYRMATRRAAAVLTVSEYARRQLIERLGVPPDRIVVAYPGIDHISRVPALPDTSLPWRYALFVGHTEPHTDI